MNAFELDESQKSVAFAPSNDRQYVIAGAGQGKTQVLISRIEYLVEIDGLNPADQILVLSFSRAAVEAARNRAAAAVAEQVSIRTFDSLASAVLFDLDEDDNFRGLSFDKRVQRATKLLRKHGLPDFLAEVKHLCVDEAQDLVGDRAQLVIAILEEADPEIGFTFLGDPLQGIYDFQLSDSDDKTSARELLRQLLDDFDARRRELRVNYRARSQRAQDLVLLGNGLRDVEFESMHHAEAAFAAIERFRSQEPTSRSFLEVTSVLDPAPDTGAILCRTNYEALVASEQMDAEGWPHSVRRRSQEVGCASWIWSALHDLAPTKYPQNTITAKICAAGRCEPEADWLALKQCEGNWRDPETLNIGLLARRLLGGSVPMVLTAGEESLLTVSTVHRAKGLEYGHVLFIESGVKTETERDFDEMTRLTYVALSRASDSILSARLILPAGTFPKKHRATGRWTESRFSRPNHYVARMEMLSSDVRATSPYSSAGLEGLSVQHNILSTALGTPAQAVLTREADEHQPAFYELQTAEGAPLGITTERFGRDVKQVFYRWGEFKWPSRLTGLRVASIECAAGAPEQTEEMGLGRSGLWLVPRFSGLARASWK
ncbi:UvrD-helicase domain-containing protein [Paenarthrobacter sp. NPDC091669]|uniref:UvrD-helicase domain-containing protein n=1 Tax=Paenarthrobacter sp. NPDC091669 TaxID=3364384 RepID=UPI00381DA469